ncbi:MAG: hypothetical protein HUJ69_05970 [Lachnospiraceae bacterium]|nr:hypothetical protein [Lachnospiraceae bacterium]
MSNMNTPNQKQSPQGQPAVGQQAASQQQAIQQNQSASSQQQAYYQQGQQAPSQQVNYYQQTSQPYSPQYSQNYNYQAPQHQAQPDPGQQAACYQQSQKQGQPDPGQQLACYQQNQTQTQSVPYQSAANQQNQMQTQSAPYQQPYQTTPQQDQFANRQQQSYYQQGQSAPQQNSQDCYQQGHQTAYYQQSAQSTTQQGFQTYQYQPSASQQSKSAPQQSYQNHTNQAAQQVQLSTNQQTGSQQSVQPAPQTFSYNQPAVQVSSTPLQPAKTPWYLKGPAPSPKQRGIWQLLVGAIFAIVLMVYAVGTIQKSDALSGDTVFLETPELQDQNEGKVVIMVGTFTVEEGCVDPATGVSINAAAVCGYVDELTEKWEEDSEDEDRRVYSFEWTTKTYRDKLLGQASLGGVPLSGELLDHLPVSANYGGITPEEARAAKLDLIQLEGGEPLSILTTDPEANDGTVSVGTFSPIQDERREEMETHVGALRYYYHVPTIADGDTVTVIGRQVDGCLVPVDGFSSGAFMEGRHTPEELMQQAKSDGITGIIIGLIGTVIFLGWGILIRVRRKMMLGR